MSNAHHNDEPRRIIFTISIPMEDITSSRTVTTAWYPTSPTSTDMETTFLTLVQHLAIANTVTEDVPSPSYCGRERDNNNNSSNSS